MRTVAAVMVAGGLVIGACGDGAAVDTTTTMPIAVTAATDVPVAEVEAPEWAVPIFEYVNALFEAANDGDPALLFPFFDQNAVLWTDTTFADIDRLAGERQLLTEMQSITVEARPFRSQPLLFVAWIPPGALPGAAGDEAGFSILAAHVADYNNQCSGDSCRLIELVSMVGVGDVLKELLRSTLIADIRRDPLDQIPAADEADIAGLLQDVEDQYFELAAALSAGDVGKVLDTDDGDEPDPGDVAQLEAITAGLTETFTTWPELQAQTLTVAELGLRDSPDPAVFFFTDTKPGDSQEEVGGFGIIRLDLSPDVTALAGMRWVRRSGVTASLDIILEVDSLDAIAGDIGLTMSETIGAWPQVPRIERNRTGTVATDDGSVVELYNAQPLQAELVEWALARYAAAGLTAPAPRSVAFPPDLRCSTFAGYAIDTGAGIDVQLCVAADEICAGEGCRPSAVSRSTLLHELGHVWTKQNVDDATRQQFMEFRGLTVWSGADIQRDLSASEHAAEVLSWGLMDESTWGARLPDSDCAVLAEGFEILTGLPPLRECPGE
jgi:hypothetical protein